MQFLGTMKGLNGMRSVIAFIIGAVIGTGGLWGYLEHKRDTARLELEKANTVLELSSKLNELYDEIMKLTNDHFIAESRYRETDNWHFLQISGEINEKLIRLKAAYWAVESRLAELEERKPRPLALDFVPPAPIKVF